MTEMMIKIDEAAVASVVRKLGSLEKLVERMDRPMDRAVQVLWQTLSTYPPRPSQSTYRRTGTLGRRWTKDVQRNGETLVGSVGNNTAYAIYVQSEQYQVAVHRATGWITDEQARSDKERAIMYEFDREIARIIEAP